MPRPLTVLVALTLPALAHDDPFAPLLAEIEKVQEEAGLKNASLGFAILALEADAPAPQADSPAPQADSPAPKADAPAPKIDTPAPQADTPAPKADTPAPQADTPAPKADTPAPKADSPAPKADSPAPVAGYHLDTALLPASTLKVVTTTTALDLLGPDFRFVTRLRHTGEIAEDGTLKGDLIIEGGGDPTLGAFQVSETFSTWQAALKQAGIAKIAGRVIGDDSLFGTQLRPDSWQWNDLGNYYAAGASGLTFHQNEFLCRFQTGEAGSEATFLGTDPKLPELTFVNEMRVGPEGSGDQGYVYGAPYARLLYLRGTVPAGGKEFTIRAALPDPALFCARAFSRHLEKNGIEVTESPSTARLLRIAGDEMGDRHDLFEQHSEALPKLISVINLRSDNLYAECLHRMIGVVQGGDGSTAAATRAVTAHWEQQGLDLTGFRMADGCGLSRANTITARQMVLLLDHAARSEHFDLFFKSLPVAGRSGTLRKIGADHPSEGRVHAKSGSFERVKTYCGYIDARSGRRYAFALFINHYTGEVAPVNEKIVRLWDMIMAL